LKEWVNRKLRNWYQNEVDEEIKGAGFKRLVKHNERNYPLSLERMMTVAEQE